MSPDEREELKREASALAYTHIRFSNLCRELTSAGWEGLAAEHAEQILQLMERLVNARLTAIESRREEMDEWLASG